MLIWMLSSQYLKTIAAQLQHPSPIWVWSLTSSTLALRDVLMTTCDMRNDPFHIEVVRKVLSAINALCHVKNARDFERKKCELELKTGRIDSIKLTWVSAWYCTPLILKYNKLGTITPASTFQDTAVAEKSATVICFRDPFEHPFEPYSSLNDGWYWPTMHGGVAAGIWFCSILLVELRMLSKACTIRQHCE